WPFLRVPSSFACVSHLDDPPAPSYVAATLHLWCLSKTQSSKTQSKIHRLSKAHPSSRFLVHIPTACPTSRSPSRARPPPWCVSSPGKRDWGRSRGLSSPLSHLFVRRKRSVSVRSCY